MPSAINCTIFSALSSYEYFGRGAPAEISDFLNSMFLDIEVEGTDTSDITSSDEEMSEDKF